MNQLNLFDTPVAHRNDPLSSYEAGEKNKRESNAKQQTQVYLAICDNEGCTARELSVKTGLDYYMIQRRVSQLINRDLICRGEPRLCRYGDSGIKVSTYYKAGK